MGSNKRITMAKRESIVPEMGDNQAAVFNNREARQLEHKRHLEELGFPKEQDKAGRPEVEGAALRYAPVSYDDPSNPTPSRVVNQAGQDLADSNQTILKENILDVSSIVKEAMGEVPLEKDAFTYAGQVIEFEDIKTKKPSQLKNLFSKAGKLLPYASLLLFNPVSLKAAGIGLAVGGAGAVIGYGAWKGWQAIDGMGRDDDEDYQSAEQTIEQLSKLSFNQRSDNQQRDLKNALDTVWGKTYGLDATGGSFVEGTTKFASPSDAVAYFEILYGGEGNIPKTDFDSFTENYALPDNVQRRQDKGIVGEVFDEIKEQGSRALGSLFGTEDAGDSLSFKEFESWAKQSTEPLLKDNTEANKAVFQGIYDVDALPESSRQSAMAGVAGPLIGTQLGTIPGLGLDIEVGSKLDSEKLLGEGAPKLPETVTIDPKDLNLKDPAGVPLAFQPGGLVGGTYKPGKGQTLDQTKPSMPPEMSPPSGEVGVPSSTTGGRTLSVDEGLIGGKQFGTISGPGTADYRIQVNPNTYPDAKPGSVIPVPDSSQAMFEAQKKIAQANPDIQPKDSQYLKNMTKMEQYQQWIQKAEDEGAMAKVQLDRVSDLADMMHDILEDGDQLPGWIQNKISDSLHNLEASISYIMYDEKQEQGLVKSKQVFHDFLAKAPYDGADIPIQKGLLALPKLLAGVLTLGLGKKLASKIFKPKKKAPSKSDFTQDQRNKLKSLLDEGKDEVEEQAKKGLPKGLLTLGGLAALPVLGTIGGMRLDEDLKNRAMQQFAALPDDQKNELENKVTEVTQQSIDSLPEPIKQKGAELFDKEFKGLSAAQIANIGAADRAPVTPPAPAAGSYIKPIFDTSPEYDKKVKQEGAPEKVIGFETQAGTKMFNKPMTRAQFGTGQQFTLSKAIINPFLMKQPSNLGTGSMSQAATEEAAKLGLQGSAFDVTSGQGYTADDLAAARAAALGAPLSGSSSPSPAPVDPFDKQPSGDAQTGILQISPETETSFGQFATGAAGKGAEDVEGGGAIAGITELFKKRLSKSFLKKQPNTPPALSNLFGGASTGSTGTKPLEVATTDAAGQPTSFKTPTGTVGTRDKNDPLFSVDPTGTKGSDVGGTMDMEGFKAPEDNTPSAPDLDFGTGGVTAGGLSYREYQEQQSLTPEFGTEAPTIQAQPGEAEFFDQFQNAIVKEAVSEFMEKAKKKKGGRKKDPRLARAGVEGFNKPKRTPKHPTKSHIVVAKEGKKIKTIRYGQQGAKTAGDPKKGESEKMKKKRKSFKARHRKNIKRGKMSAAYWADKSKW